MGYLMLYSMRGKANKYIVAIISTAMLLSCNSKEFDSIENKPEDPIILSFTASFANNETKTVLQDGGVYWSPLEEIMVYHTNTLGKFTSENDAVADRAVFSGYLSARGAKR